MPLSSDRADISDAVIPPEAKKDADGASPPGRVRAKTKKAGKTARNFRLTDRDYEILKAVNRYRFLRTGQIKRLLFSDASTPQTARRRLRNLSDPGYRYLDKIEPYVQVGKGNAESAWYLDRGGEELLRAFGEPLLSYSYKNSGNVGHLFLAHALALSEFRVRLELALRNHPVVELGRLIADFEMKSHTTEAVDTKIFKLYKEVRHPNERNETYIVYPDALIILQGKGAYSKSKRLYFVEIDRGTESESHIRKKVIGYSLYLQQRVFQNFGKFEGFCVLFQTISPKRAENMRKALVGTEGSDLVWITDVQRVTEETILSKPIWTDHKGNFRAIMRE